MLGCFRGRFPHFRSAVRLAPANIDRGRIDHVFDMRGVVRAVCSQHKHRGGGASSQSGECFRDLARRANRDVDIASLKNAAFDIGSVGRSALQPLNRGFLIPPTQTSARSETDKTLLNSGK